MKLLRQVNNNIKYVLFDKDGTLLDLDSVWVDWLNNVKYYLIINGWIKENKISEFIKDIGIKEDKVILDSPLSVASENEMQTIIAYHLYSIGIDWQQSVEITGQSFMFANDQINKSSNMQLIKGVEKFLEKLYYSGRKIGVITADTQENAENHLYATNIANWFHFIIGSDCVERSKPYPDMLDLAEKRYGVKMEETLFLGDSEVDVRMANLKQINQIVGVNNPSLITEYAIENFENIQVIDMKNNRK